LTCAQKAYMSKINLKRTVENRKNKVKTDTLRSIDKQSGESVESVRGKKT